MFTAIVEAVRSTKTKNGKDMLVVKIEGKEYVTFDKKWATLEGNLVKYDIITKENGFIDVVLGEVVGKKEQKQEELPNKYAVAKPIVTSKEDMALSLSQEASVAFIKSGVITTPDEWLTFLRTATKEVEAFLSEEKETISE